MKIKSIEPIVVSQKLKETFHFSQWEYDTRTICLVRITTDNGTYGWGEGYGPASLVKAGIDFFSPFILGMDALNHENIWQVMYLRSLDYARRGVLLAALTVPKCAISAKQAPSKEWRPHTSEQPPVMLSNLRCGALLCRLP